MDKYDFSDFCKKNDYKCHSVPEGYRIFLVYQSDSGEQFFQEAEDVVASGSLIDPDTDDDMAVFGIILLSKDDEKKTMGEGKTTAEQ